MSAWLRNLFIGIRKRIAGQEITVYPSYGYRDPGDDSTWIVPVRVWVHDNRDTPFVERVVNEWAAGHFEKDLKRELDAAEKAQLHECLQNFIAVFRHAFPRCSNLYLINQHPPLNTRTNQALSLGASGCKAMFNKKKISAHWEV